MKSALLFLAFAGLLCSQVLLQTLADISGDSAAHAIAAQGAARWVDMCAPAANSNVVRAGDSSVSATQGRIIVAGTCFHMDMTQQLPGYDLSRVYYRVVTGDKLSITWAK